MAGKTRGSTGPPTQNTRMPWRRMQESATPPLRGTHLLPPKVAGARRGAHKTQSREQTQRTTSAAAPTRRDSPAFRREPHATRTARTRRPRRLPTRHAATACATRRRITADAPARARRAPGWISCMAPTAALGSSAWIPAARRSAACANRTARRAPRRAYAAAASATPPRIRADARPPTGRARTREIAARRPIAAPPTNASSTPCAPVTVPRAPRRPSAAAKSATQ
jgi:hypothetical protein